MITKLLVAHLFTTIALLAAQAAGPDHSGLYEQIDAVMRNWRSITPEYLHDPVNLALLTELRRKAHDSSYERVRALLLKIDDLETTSLCLAEFQTNQRARGDDIALSGNPKLILALAPALFREESPETKKFPDGDEVRRVRPLSVRAAFAIRELILNSTAFSPAVVISAKNAFEIGKINSETLRARVRTWVTQNRPALATGNYSAVTPFQP
jgi:hypothetical protein